MDAGGADRRDEALALRAFAERGGRVIAGGRAGGWIATLLGDAAAARVGGRRAGDARAARPPRRRPPGVARVETAGDGRWARRRRAAGAGRRPGLAAARRAASATGAIALLADTSPLQNRLLGKADNAALALALSGRGPLTFVESVHGYGPQRGLAAIPARFGWALIGLLLAALVFMVARGRRLGPPELERRELPPPRRAYVDSLAATMARGKAREEARRAGPRGGPPPARPPAGLREDAPPDAWLEAAARRRARR